MRKGYFLLLLFFIIALCSCATIPPVEKPPAVGKVPSKETVPAYRKTTIHEVGPGETAWRISKMYDVPIGEIVKANNLRDASKIKMGQKLVIPNATSASPVIALYPNKKWKYIIIHHSATDIGSALSIHHGHERRGFIEGLGYHFLIDNGTLGKADGQIETSPRWTKQQNGAHCKAGEMNYKAIGICVVGNLNQEKLTKKQMDSLVALVNTLRKYYHIPIKNIIGHGEVKGAKTECPGRLFPEKEFYKRLKRDTQTLESVRGRIG
ncbi:MAG: N-acetylmuramoyl-L-alanine amidase [Candidatus Omnitrophota bacterium]